MTKCYIPKRFAFTILGFFGTLIVYATRTSMSVAMVAMVNFTHDTSSEAKHENPEFLFNMIQDSEQHFEANPSSLLGKKYNWNSKTQSFILSAFYYGYVITQLPGGILCKRFGAKWFFAAGVLMTTGLYMLIPLAASLGVIVFVIIRIMEGLGQGVIYPAIAFGVSRWAPKFERSRVFTIINLGAPLGNIIGAMVSGSLCSSDLFGGWPSTFYMLGTIGSLWVILWGILAYETPEQHPGISKEELLYIQKNQSEKSEMDVVIPWKDIFSSLPTWAVIIAHFGFNYAYLMFIAELPTYFKTVLHFDIKTNGFLSALPHLVQALSGTLSSSIADKLRESRKLSITNIRKICNSIGLIGPGLCCLSIVAAGNNSGLIIILFCLSMFLNGFAFSGFAVTHVDMSPNFSGILFGISNTVSCSSAIFSPMIVGFLTMEGVPQENWSKVFYITSAVYISTALFYAIFASAELQPWDSSVKNQMNKKDTSPNDTSDKISKINVANVKV